MRPADDNASVENPVDPARLRTQLAERFHAPLVSFFLRRIKDRSQAEDLAQDVLVRIISARKLEQVAQPEAYVFKIAINLLRDRVRQELHDAAATFIPIDDALAGELESALVEDLSPERVLLSRDTLADALRTLEELGERTHDIFVLFRLENMRQRDIALLYGIGQSTVEKHVMKAVLHLSAKYGRKGLKDE